MRSTTRRLASFAFAGLVVSLAGCNGQGECLDDQRFFQEKVWGEVMSKSCAKCHTPDGVAAEQNAKLLLLTSSYPGFMATNRAVVQEVARNQYNGTSMLLLKPTGRQNHGGGMVIAEGSPEFKILKEMVDRTAKPVSCGAQDPAAAYQGHLTLLSPLDTLRKAALDLASRLPTAEETQRVQAGGEAELAAVLDGLLREPGFDRRIREIWNDILLTRRYQYGALGLLNDTDFPKKWWWNPQKLGYGEQSDAQRIDARYIDYGLSAEPVELVAHVVKEDRPFTEVLAAPYTMVNPWSARVYGLDVATLGFANPADYFEFREAKLRVARPAGELEVPHSGLLTQIAFLRRYPTTPTNLNRHRARTIFRLFLATDVLKVAERPIDPSSVTSLNPTRDDAYCKVCHKMIDPVAGMFQKWDWDARFIPDFQWPPAMPQPGLGDKKVDSVAEYPRAVSTLAKWIGDDPRFAYSLVGLMYKAMIGREPLAYPAVDSPAFAGELKAWSRQQAVFQKIGADFVAANYNLKAILKGIVLSADYRAVAAMGLGAGEAEGLGIGRLLPSEMLAARVGAVTGTRWYQYQQYEWLTTDFNLLYGGLNFDTVNERLGEPNGVMTAVQERLANEMACRLTAWDFTRDKASRRLFPGVEITNRPLDDNGYEVPQSIVEIKQNIRFLHKKLLGEPLGDSDPELARTYALFLDTWKELQANKKADLAWDCQGRWDRDNNANTELPKDRIIDQDKHFTIRAWMAVVSYLLSDYKFLYE